MELSRQTRLSQQENNIRKNSSTFHCIGYLALFSNNCFTNDIGQTALK